MTVTASTCVSYSVDSGSICATVEFTPVSRYAHQDSQCDVPWVLWWSYVTMNDTAVLAVFKRAIHEQDQSAWHTIWDRYHPVIFRKMHRELAGWVTEAEEIRDITQMVFIKFWEDSKEWKSVDRLYTEGKREGILSRLHSTAVFTVQRHRQTLVRKWIPLIRENIPLCAEAEQIQLQSLARERLDQKYRDIFMLHLRRYENATIARLMQMELRDVSIRINRAWERFVYVLLLHRRQNPGFDPLFQHLIAARREVEQ